MFQCPFFGTHIHTLQNALLERVSLAFQWLFFWSHNTARKNLGRLQEDKMFNTITPLLKLAYYSFVKHFLGVTYIMLWWKKIGYYIVTLIDYTTKLLL